MIVHTWVSDTASESELFKVMAERVLPARRCASGAVQTHPEMPKPIRSTQCVLRRQFNVEVPGDLRIEISPTDIVYHDNIALQHVLILVIVVGGRLREYKSQSLKRWGRAVKCFVPACPEFLPDKTRAILR